MRANQTVDYKVNRTVDNHKEPREEVKNIGLFFLVVIKTSFITRLNPGQLSDLQKVRSNKKSEKKTDEVSFTSIRPRIRRGVLRMRKTRTRTIMVLASTNSLVLLLPGL